MSKKDLGGLSEAIVEVRKLIKDYGKGDGASLVLLERLVELERVLLDDFFRAATADGPVKRAPKKVVKVEKTEKVEGADKGGGLTKPDPLKVGPNK